MMASKIVVLGLGNLLLGDEGAGVRVIERLRREGAPGNVELIDGGTMGFGLLQVFTRADLVVVVDAACDGRAPGTVTQLSPSFDPEYLPVIMPHDIGLKNLLDAAAWLGKTPEVVLFTISVPEGERVSLGLSRPVARGVRAAARQVTEFLQTAGR
jgi:hydrogenase maturation protease